MSKNTKITLVIVLILALIFIGVGMADKKIPSETKPIKIGFVGPLSGFGAPWGEEQKFAIETAVSEINKNGGVLGRSFEVVYEDGKCTEKEASTAAQKLTAIDKVDFLFAVCGAESLSVASIADKSKIVMIGLWATNPQLSGISPYVFRNSYSDDDSGRILAEAVNNKHKSTSIITGLAGYPVGLRDGFKKYYTGKVYEEDYQPGISDFKTIVTKILAKSPGAVFINANAQSEAVAILRQLELLRYKGAIVMNFFGSIDEVQKMSYAKGVIYPFDPIVPDNSRKEKLYNEFLAKMQRKPNFEFAVGISYDSVYILKKAIEETKGVDSEKIRNYLHLLKDFTGVLGTYGFNEKGDATGYQPSLKQI